ncbi:MAG: alpha/beta hydrolase [Planctomycetes bacterium]|nr:alpha/beta hydrolase [Planctomycetota bacterium]
MPRLSLDSLTLHYQQTGDGPDVVLVHAFTGNLAVWAFSGIMEALESEFRVTAYDLRGHGASSVPPAGYNSAQMADDFRRMHDALGLRPAYVVGHSYGGVVAMHAAVLHPEKVAGVILSDTYFPGLRDLEPDMGQTDIWREMQEQFLAVGEEIGNSVDFSRLFQIVRRLTPEQMQGIKRQMGAAGARWLAQAGQLADTTAGEEMFEVAGLTRERLCEIRQPVLALYDEHSPFKATCRFLIENLPNCRADIVPGAKHFAPVECAETFNDMVRSQLRQWREE